MRRATNIACPHTVGGAAFRASLLQHRNLRSHARRVKVAEAYARRVRTLQQCSLQAWQAYLAKRRWKRRRFADAHALHSRVVQEHAVAQCLELGLRLHAHSLQRSLQQCAATFAEQLRFVRPFALRWLARSRIRAAERLDSARLLSAHVQGQAGYCAKSSSARHRHEDTCALGPGLVGADGPRTAFWSQPTLCSLMPRLPSSQRPAVAPGKTSGQQQALAANLAPWPLHPADTFTWSQPHDTLSGRAHLVPDARAPPPGGGDPLAAAFTCQQEAALAPCMHRQQRRPLHEVQRQPEQSRATAQASLGACVIGEVAGTQAWQAAGAAKRRSQVRC